MDKHKKIGEKVQKGGFVKDGIKSIGKPSRLLRSEDPLQGNKRHIGRSHWPSKRSNSQIRRC